MILLVELIVENLISEWGRRVFPQTFKSLKGKSFLR